MRTGTQIFVWHFFLNSGVLCLADSLVLLLGLYLGNWIVYLIHGVPISIQYSLAVVPVWCIGALVGRVVPAWGIGAVEEFRRIQLLLLIVFSIAGIVVFFSRDHLVPSRIVYGFSYLFDAIFIPLVRIPFKKLLLSLGAWGCPAAIYGSFGQAELVISDFKRNPFLGYVPKCVFLTDERSKKREVHGISVQGGAWEVSKQAAVALVSVSWAENVALLGQFDQVFSRYRRVLLIPSSEDNLFLWSFPRTLGHVMGFEVASNLLNPFACFLKRGMDIGLICLFFPIWMPLMIAVTLLIVLVDRHNPFFFQSRIGRRNHSFFLFKFRTMVDHAESLLESTLAGNKELQSEWQKNHKLTNDPRVTRLGRFLRRTSLDELPQIFNVLIGHMSLVGPRPLPSDHHQKLTDLACAPRARVRPGITGLWQVSGRSEVDIAEMEKWDTYYVRNWSIWLDITILIRTVWVVIKGTGAY